MFRALGMKNCVHFNKWMNEEQDCELLPSTVENRTKLKARYPFLHIACFVISAEISVKSTRNFMEADRKTDL